MKFKAIGNVGVNEIELPVPDRCPRCLRSVHPRRAMDYAVGSADHEVATLFICPAAQCGKAFLAVYVYTGDYILTRLEPRARRFMIFSDPIKSISADFCEIYNQTLHAEEEGLVQIAGPGYRKALEFLIKDYVSREAQNALAEAKASKNEAAFEAATKSISEIQTQPLAAVIEQRIPDGQIKETAKRATWLGNDETHYVRKWEDHDLKDLKDLISLMVRFVESHETYQAMIARMPEGKQ